MALIIVFLKLVIFNAQWPQNVQAQVKNLAINAKFQVQNVVLSTPTVTEAHSESSQISKMEHFEEIVNEIKYN